MCRPPHAGPSLLPQPRTIGGMHSNEPKSAAAVKRWIEKHTRTSDRFASVAHNYQPHRREHGCDDLYPSSNGPLLGALAAAAKPKRLLEVGCGLGYSGLWLAYGAGTGGYVETIEASKEHAKIARGHFKAEGLEKRIQVLVGEATRVLPALKGRYDLIYFDINPSESLVVLDHSERLLRTGGLLISANLFLGEFAPHIPGLERTAEYRLRILDAARWLTGYTADGTSISVRV
jgi:predicted O-methyltransferase YrrM